MANHQIEKPNLFISHASTDAEFANVLKAEIEKVFADGLNVFCTSSPGAISPSADWLQAIEDRLGKAQAVIVIVTPISIERPWLWFEVGASWLRARSQSLAIYPLCAPEINFSDLPSPLDRLQALSMGNAIDLKLLFESLIRQFGFGKISSFRAANVIKRIPKYANVKPAEIDLNDRILYNGKYRGYAKDELKEIIRTTFLYPEIRSYIQSYRPGESRENNVFAGKLLHFRRVDKTLDLPSGTSKELLIPIAGEYGLEPELATDNMIRFKQTKWFKQTYIK